RAVRLFHCARTCTVSPLAAAGPAGVGAHVEHQPLEAAELGQGAVEALRQVGIVERIEAHPGDAAPQAIDLQGRARQWPAVIQVHGASDAGAALDPARESELQVDGTTFLSFE